MIGDICKLEAVGNLKLKKFVGKTHGGAVFFSTKGVNVYIYIYLYLDIYSCIIDTYLYLYVHVYEYTYGKFKTQNMVWLFFLALKV
jgi:hypothetical protein